jgi:hypothetical protein
MRTAITTRHRLEDELAVLVAYVILAEHHLELVNYQVLAQSHCGQAIPIMMANVPIRWFQTGIDDSQSDILGGSIGIVTTDDHPATVSMRHPLATRTIILLREVPPHTETRENHYDYDGNRPYWHNRFVVSHYLLSWW